jgi:hypothetical protein
MSNPELGKLTGAGIERRYEVSVVKNQLAKIHIFLEGFSITITAVYIKPRPIGFDFDCIRPASLLTLVRSKAALYEDNTDTLEGEIMAGATPGLGLREIGSGPRVHLEIGMDGKCNVHIDSHGLVAAPGEYDYNLALEHGYWDLLADKVPGLFGSFGSTGQVGPMIRPMKGVDGKERWVIGLTGHW